MFHQGRHVYMYNVHVYICVHFVLYNSTQTPFPLSSCKREKLGFRVLDVGPRKAICLRKIYYLQQNQGFGSALI